MNEIARYRIPGIVVTTKGTVPAYRRRERTNSADWGEIEIHPRHSTDGTVHCLCEAKKDSESMISR